MGKPRQDVRHDRRNIQALRRSWNFATLGDQLWRRHASSPPTWLWQPGASTSDLPVSFLLVWSAGVSNPTGDHCQGVPGPTTRPAPIVSGPTSTVKVGPFDVCGATFGADTVLLPDVVLPVNAPDTSALDHCRQRAADRLGGVLRFCDNTDSRSPDKVREPQPRRLARDSQQAISWTVRYRFCDRPAPSRGCVGLWRETLPG